MKRVLITGGSGFIGTNMVEYYITKGVEALNVDIVKPLDSNHNLYWKECDINEIDMLKNIFNDFRPTHIMHLAAGTGMDVSDGILQLEKQLSQEKNNIYNNLNRWERVQLARHPKRPYSLDYIIRITDYWLELHGDRYFSDDPAMVCGIAKINDIKFMLISQEKGRGTKSKVFRNFGMARPEGYRKALRLMKLAEKYSIPVVTLIDTPGAYPGKGAEERGQAEAIAANLLYMSNIKVPTLSVIIGEGASGGALGIGLTDKIICFENTWYSVISPEGCASILFRDTNLAEQAADSMKVTAKDLELFNIADYVISEPLGGIQLDYNYAFEEAKIIIKEYFNRLHSKSITDLIKDRHAKYQNIGIWKNE